MDVDRKLARDLAQGRQRRIVVVAHDIGQQAVALAFKHVGHFRRLHVIGAGVLGMVDRRQHGIEIGLWVETRAHGDQADFEG
jgi:hypothetical protein